MSNECRVLRAVKTNRKLNTVFPVETAGQVLSLNCSNRLNLLDLVTFCYFITFIYSSYKMINEENLPLDGADPKVDCK